MADEFGICDSCGDVYRIADRIKLPSETVGTITIFRRQLPCCDFVAEQQLQVTGLALVSDDGKYTHLDPVSGIPLDPALRDDPNYNILAKNRAAQEAHDE